MHLTTGGLSYSSHVTKCSHVGAKDLNRKHEFSVGSDGAAGENPCTEILVTVTFQRLLLSPSAVY